MVAAGALVLTGASQPASTVTKTVKITATAFSPTSVTIPSGSAIKWSNTDTKTHQVVSNTGAFASPIIAPGRTYTHTFNTAGTYRYHDGLHPSLTGRVIVTGPPPAVTIAAGAPIITYGQATHIAGTVSNGQAGETVTVYAQPAGAPSFTLIATLLTGTGGAWDTVVKPSLLTTYQAHWKSTVSSTVMVAVHPKVRFTLRRGHGAVRVTAARSMAGHKVYIQRFTRFHEWVKIRRVILGSNSARSFRLKLPRGRYVLRAYMTVNQAGFGYLDGISRNIVYRVR
ncbi:MAG: cupredoxin domain-containing protein [Gaiellaceae bacterium]